MIDTRHPVCKGERCTRQPSFGTEGDRRASYCARHREPGMVNVTSRRCQMLDCVRHPNFGEHRHMGMVDVVSRRCRNPFCVRRPLYNLGGLRPVWCSRHKLPGMIDVVSARCQAPGCFSHPSFGYAADRKPLRCAKHRLKGMEGVKGRRKKPLCEATEAVPAVCAGPAAAGAPAQTMSYPSSSSPDALGQVEGMHEERRAITAEIVQGLSLRIHATWSEAAGSPLSSLHQQKLRVLLYDGTGATGEGRQDQGYRLTNHVRSRDHNNLASLEGAALPSLPATGGAQSLLGNPRQPSPRQLPTPPNLQHPPPGQSTSLAHLDRFTAARNADTTATTRVVATTLCRSRSDDPVVAPSSSPSAWEGETFATSSYAGSCSGNMAGGSGILYDYRPRASHNSPRCRSYLVAEPPLTSGLGPWPESWRAGDRESSLGNVDGGDAQKVGDGAGGTSRLQQSVEEHSNNQCRPLSTLSRGKQTGEPVGVGGVRLIEGPPSPRTVGPGSGYQHAALSATGSSKSCRETASEPSKPAHLKVGGEYSKGSPAATMDEREGAADGNDSLHSTLSAHHPHWVSHSVSSSSSFSTAAVATLTTAKLSPPPSWDSPRFGGSSEVEARAVDQKQGDGRLVSPQMGGGQWSSGASDHGGGSGGAIAAATMEDADPDHNRGFRFGDRRRRSSALEGHQYHLHPSQPQSTYKHENRSSEFRSTFTAVDCTAAVSASKLGREVSDPGAYSVGSMRPWFPFMANAVRPLSNHSISAGMPALDAVVGGHAAVGRSRFTFGEQRNEFGSDSGGGGGGGGGALDACTTDEGRTQQRRSSDTWSTSPTHLEAGCDRRPRNADSGSKELAYCARHRTVGVVDGRHPLCRDVQCTRQSSFGMEGDQRASFCAKHKEEGTINVSSRRCLKTECTRHPNCGFPGDRRASCCRGHRVTRMVDFVSRRCRHPSCARRPLYNFDGMRPECCSVHQVPGMVDVVSTRFQEPGCMCHPFFGYAHDKKAQRCAKHHLEDMEGGKVED
eukprot:g18436.t1